MASSKTLTKSLLAFSRFLLRSFLHRRNPHPPHVKLQKYPPSDRLASETLIFDVEGALLRSPSTFPFFMLVALESTGGLLRALLLLLLYPALCCIASEGDLAVKMMTMVCFCGARKDHGPRAGRAMLPKYLLEEVGAEAFEMVRKGGRRVGVTAMPRVMVEVFLKEYLEVEAVVGRELRVVFGGFYTGFMEEEVVAEVEVAGGIGFGSYSTSMNHRLFSKCKEVYMVTQAEKRGWHPLPRCKYPKPLIFHDGRFAFLPRPLATAATLLWVPLGIPLSVLRVLLFAVLPYPLAIPIGALTGLSCRYTASTPSSSPRGMPHRRHLYVCNHRTLLDPVYISTFLPKPVTAVTYSLSNLSELLSPIRTVRLTRNKEEDRKLMAQHLQHGDLVVCPEGTTCREPYLLRFSPLFAELADDIVPVALDTRVSMFYGTTAGGFKWMDPFYFLMNPKPEYQIKFLERIVTETGKEREVANRVQREIGKVWGFECTSLTRKDKYLMLAGNEG